MPCYFSDELHNNVDGGLQGVVRWQHCCFCCCCIGMLRCCYIHLCYSYVQDWLYSCGRSKMRAPEMLTAWKHWNCWHSTTWGLCRETHIHSIQVYINVYLNESKWARVVAVKLELELGKLRRAQSKAIKQQPAVRSQRTQERAMTFDIKCIHHFHT